MPQPIRVLLVEDHQLVAEGIQALLDREADIKVIGVAGTVKEPSPCPQPIAPTS